MNILLLRHYPLVEGYSMKAFASQIALSMRARGNRVSELTAPVLVGRLLPRKHVASKWLGYIDQYVIFPPLLWMRALALPDDSLIVLSDQALGPWFPWLAGRPHVVHCHDLLALEGSLGLQPFHRVHRFGRWYQRWIRRGFCRAHCFLSVSAATRFALEANLLERPLLSEVLYNPLPQRFSVLPEGQAASVVAKAFPQIREESYLFHIGRGWYKNRMGLLAIWSHLCRLDTPIHLVLVGAPDATMKTWLLQHQQLAPWLHFLEHASDNLVVALYNRAAGLLYPSHAEGFGWPVLEALACGCPVLTTDLAPMTEVGGEAATYIPPMPVPPASIDSWAQHAAHRLKEMLSSSPAVQAKRRQLGLVQARNFRLRVWEDQLDTYYTRALALQKGLGR